MSEPTFEEALKRLENIASELEKENVDLETSLKLFEEGVMLSRTCARKLEEAEKKIEMLTREESGRLNRVPFDPGTLETESGT
ncbi:MAG TPA: exodeoxyribonuclease VII small subunit [bacterium]|nr:exodeoxyribonuclease VII small subunit [bacterium]